MNLPKADLKVMIVEDNPGDQFLVSELLGLLRIHTSNICIADTIADAKVLLTNCKPDIILLDLTLPDSSGIETFQQLNTLEPTIPIVILSGIDDTNLALQAITFGAQDYLQKGDFDEKLLSRSIQYSIERKKTMEELKASVERYALVSKATNDMVWDWDMINDSVFRNEEQFCRLLKLPASVKDSSGEFWLGRVHPDDIHELSDLIENVKVDSSKNVFEIEYRFLNGEDNYLHLLDRGYILRDEHGQSVRIIGSTQDITRQKEINSELEKLSRIARETKNGVIITDKYQCVEWVNEAFERLSGYTLSEIKGLKPGSFLQGPETDSAQVAYMHTQLRKKKSFEIDLINYHKQGGKYWINLQVQPILDDRGNLQQFFSIQTDITAQKKAEEALIRSEEQYRYLFDNNPAPIFIWHIDDFSFAEVNETFVKTYGYSRSELSYMTIKQIRPVEEIPAIISFAKLSRKKEHFFVTRVWKHKTKKGDVIYMQVSSQRITYKNRPAILAIAIDITEKKMLELKLEEERKQKEKEITNAVLTAQENEKEFIGRELHDNVNQILASARLFFGVSKKTLSEETIQKADELVGKAIREIRALCHSLIPPSFDVTNLSDGIEQMVSLIENETDIRFIKQYHDADYSKLPQVMQLTIYRTVQEQLNNILKYARAKNVLIQTILHDKELTLVIEDDGIGFDTTQKKMGVVFLNIQTRASICNGTMELTSKPGEGCSLKLHFTL